MNERYYAGGVFVDVGCGDYVDAPVDPYTKGELVEEAVLDEAGVWHHARCGLTDPNDPCSRVVHWYATYCGRRIRSGLGWRDAEAVKKSKRCQQCQW